MDTSTRRTHRTMLRRVAMMAALAALIAPAGSAEAAKKKVKAPVITSVSPMDAEVGDTLSIRGRNFRPGAAKNTVVFKRDGSRAVFVKSTVATRKLIRVKVPARLTDFMVQVGTAKAPTRFRIRVLAKRFGKSFTSDKRSPLIGPDKPPPPPLPPGPAKANGDCDGDGVLNKDETDADNDKLTDAVELSLGLDPCKVDTDADGLEDRWEFDCDRDSLLNRDESDDDADLLSDALEGTLMTDPCSADTDLDGVEDSYEYKSAIDLNDDSYQQPNQALPYPGKRPYSNPLFKDADVDYDGDSLTLLEEYKLWKYTYEVTHTSARPLTEALFASTPLSYSDGLQRSVPGLAADTYVKWFGQGTGNVCGGSPCDELGFMTWAERNGYAQVTVLDSDRDLLDVDLDDTVSPTEQYMFDLRPDGIVSDDERDEDADGLTNFDETHGRMRSEYWAACYSMEAPFSIAYAGTSHVDADSDGDGIRDGADDQDHDDIPNVMELSRFAASGLDDTEDGIELAWGTGAGMAECTPDVDLPAPPEQHHPDAYGQVYPFDPCKPDRSSRTCTLHPAVGQAGEPTWYSLN